MKPYARHLFVLICPLLSLAACGHSGQQNTARLLDHRLQAQLAPDIAAGNATLQPMPDGARVTLLGPWRFTNGPGALEARRPDTRASVIEGLLDPALMRIDVSDTSNLPAEQRAARVDNVRQYFTDVGLGSTLQPEAPPLQAPADVAASGLTINISVQCPHYHRVRGDSGKAMPACH